MGKRSIGCHLDSLSGGLIKKKAATSDSTYEESIQKLCTFDTIEDFWAYYSYLIRPNELPPGGDYNLFRTGTVPLWEDSANKNGGKWVIRLRKGVANRCWEDVVLAFISDFFDLKEEVCGLVISTKYSEDFLSIWNKNANDRDSINRIRDTLKDILDIPDSNLMEYIPHDESIRNTLIAHLRPAGGGSGTNSTGNSPLLPAAIERSLSAPSYPYSPLLLSS